MITWSLTYPGTGLYGTLNVKVFLPDRFPSSPTIMRMRKEQTKIPANHCTSLRGRRIS